MLRPALDDGLLWILISNLSLNYLSLLERDALCSVLRAYDFRALVDRQAERIAQKGYRAYWKLIRNLLTGCAKDCPYVGCAR